MTLCIDLLRLLLESNILKQNTLIKPNSTEAEKAISGPATSQYVNHKLISLIFPGTPVGTVHSQLYHPRCWIVGTLNIKAGGTLDIVWPTLRKNPWQKEVELWSIRPVQSFLPCATRPYFERARAQQTLDDGNVVSLSFCFFVFSLLSIMAA